VTGTDLAQGKNVWGNVCLCSISALGAPPFRPNLGLLLKSDARRKTNNLITSTAKVRRFRIPETGERGPRERAGKVQELLPVSVSRRGARVCLKAASNPHQMHLPLPWELNAFVRG
jgi:hypothetical protein